jgi:hypothetical protein
LRKFIVQLPGERIRDREKIALTHTSVDAENPTFLLTPFVRDAREGYPRIDLVICDIGSAALTLPGLISLFIRTR